MKNRIIELAQAQVGNGYTEYCRAFGFNYRIEWCATFISWLSKECGLEEIIPISMSCTKMSNEFRKIGGVWHGKGDMPEIGDIMFYDWNEAENDGVDHVGIVESIIGENFTVIEGNKNDTVARRTINKNYSMIYGFARPNYSAKSVSVSALADPVIAQAPASKWDYQYDGQITELQQILNAKGADLAVDGIAGDKTFAAVKKYTIENGDKGPLTKWVQSRLNSMGYNCGAADGIAGKNTMSGIAQFQAANSLGQGYLGGEDWYFMIK